MLETIRSNIKTSLLAGDRFRVEALKLAQAALMNAKIEKRADLTESEEIAVIQKEIKKRKEAQEMYLQADSPDRAEKEAQEMEILSEFVPRLVTGVELSQAVDAFLSTAPKDIAFADAMRQAIDHIENADKSQLAGILKSKLS